MQARSYPASSMGVDVGDRASEKQPDWVYGTGFTAGSLARIVSWDGMWRPGIEELTEVECGRGGMEE